MNNYTKKNALMKDVSDFKNLLCFKNYNLCDNHEIPFQCYKDSVLILVRISKIKNKCNL